MNWKEISRNPVDSQVHHFLLEHLKKMKVTVDDPWKVIKGTVSGMNVLDIGVVEHDISHIEHANWKHRKLKQLAKKIVGVDILEAEVNLLNQKGFDVRLADATSAIDLGERFDAVVIGDVIEHVDNPIQLLEFAARHAKEGASIMVSTPNPYYFKYIQRTISQSTFIANAEHIAWVTPTMALEIGRRAGVHLTKYYAVVGRPQSAWKRVLRGFLVWLFSPFISKDSEVYASDYIYFFCK